MNKIAKVFGRLLAVLINNAIISKEEAEYILEPLKEYTKPTNFEHECCFWDDKNQCCTVGKDEKGCPDNYECSYFD